MTVADAEFWHKVADERAAEILRLRSDNQKLREALAPFATSHVAENVDEHGWTSNIHREQISVWFGPSDFFSARAALAATDMLSGLDSALRTGEEGKSGVDVAEEAKGGF